jgi:hypothetical protein
LKPTNDFNFLVSASQRLVIADMINNEFLRFFNNIEVGQPLFSNLEMVMKQLGMCQNEAAKIGFGGDKVFKFESGSI